MTWNRFYLYNVMYQNYIFDFYGTLVDIRTDEDSPILWAKMSEIYSAWGASYTADELKSEYKRLVNTEAAKLPEHGEPDLRLVFAKLFENKGIACDMQLVKSVSITFRALSREKLRVYDGVKEALAELKNRGKGVYLLSNAQTDFTRPEIEMMGLTKYFDDIFISSEAGYKKPSKEFYDRLISRFGLNPKNCLMVGNDETADIQGAIMSGMDSLYLHTECSPEIEESRATYVVMDGDWKKVSTILLSK